MFGGSRCARCVLDKRALLFNNANAQVRCESKLARPKATETNKYRRKEKSINLSEYSLLAIPIAAFALGTWQVKRWRWKLDLIEKLNERSTTEPFDFPFDLNELKDKEYYRVKVRGRFLYDKEFLMGPKSLILHGEAVSEKGGAFTGRSTTGYQVVTPFKLENQNVTIMVNRGWIPRHDRSTFKTEDKFMDNVEIVGVVRGTEKRPTFVADNIPAKGVWHFRDLDAMAKVAETEPVYIELVPGYNGPRGPIGGQTKINLRNEHLSYIITWYALSAATGYMWFRQFVQRAI